MSDESKVKYAHSSDGEIYHGEFDTPEEAAAEGLAGHDPDFARTWVGEIRPPAAPEKIAASCAETLLENIDDDDDYQGEWAEDWLETTPAQINDLQERLCKTIGEWFDAHNLRPKFFNIEDAEEWVMDEGKPVRATEVEVEGT